jgi:hypothetical protein
MHSVKKYQVLTRATWHNLPEDTILQGLLDIQYTDPILALYCNETSSNLFSHATVYYVFKSMSPFETRNKGSINQRIYLYWKDSGSDWSVLNVTENRRPDC